jgi:HD-GYP domain-containing protein (c-di-GMP phosphodiesterase class II)
VASSDGVGRGTGPMGNVHASPCEPLLDEAVDRLGCTDGVIFVFGPDGGPQPLAMHRGLSAKQLARLKDVARSVARARQPVAGSQPGDLGLSGLLTVPLEVGSQLVGVLVASGVASPDLSTGGQLERLGYLRDAIALAVDRQRILEALGRRGREVTALREQLDAYALDFGPTYRAERNSSQQLAVALEELERTYKATLGALALAAEAKDECTDGHLYRVSRYGMLLTKLVAPEHANDPQFEYGFVLHDIGKLKVPDQVLNKPGPLSDEEWELMRAHPAEGRSILDGIAFLEGAREIVYCHHERWDGQGYPRGLREEQIPVGARIFPICDAFDAMTTDRPYRAAMTADHAREKLRSASGTQFWPDAVEAFMAIPDEVLVPRGPERRTNRDLWYRGGASAP